MRAFLLRAAVYYSPKLRARKMHSEALNGGQVGDKTRSLAYIGYRLSRLTWLKSDHMVFGHMT
jgi:hypothetical protein